MSLTNELINEIRQKADIVDVIRQYLNLEQKGNAYYAICPFHDDRNPSLSVSKDKQIYKCFVCGNGGNVFTFVQNYENIGFVEAVAKVAKSVGIELNVQVNKQQHIDPEIQELYQCFNEANKYLNYSLKTDLADNALTYLKKRGIDEHIIEDFKIGYNGHQNVLYNFLHAKQIEDHTMVEANLIRVSNNGVYDVFSDRITFPIANEHGQIVGYTARTLNNDESKYINTAQTKIYNKGHIIYNYHRCKNYAKQKNIVYLVEGVMDVIAFERAGFKNVVASLGTALTSYQANLLKRLNCKVVIAYDGDNAGISATLKAIKLLQEINVDVMVMNNDSSMDPDDIVNKLGIDKLQSVASKLKTAVEFMFDYYLSKYNLDNYSEKKEFVQIMEQEINSLKDDFDKRNFKHRLQQITGLLIDVNVPQTTKKQSVVPLKITRPTFGYEESEKIILEQMLKHPEAINKFKVDLGFFIVDKHQKLALIMIDYYRKNGIIDAACLLDEIDDLDVKKLLLELSLSNTQDEYSEEKFIGAHRRIKLFMLQQQEQTMKNKIKNVSNIENKLILIQELKELQLERRRLIEDEEK